MFTRNKENEGAAEGQQSPPSGDIVENRTASDLRPPQAPSIKVEPAMDGSRGINETIISSDLTIIGNVTSKGNVKLDGTIRGDMYCSSLVVSENGEIDGGIVANDVAILGRVTGSIRGTRVMLYSTASVQGDIFHQGIGIEMGTMYDGTLRWTEDPTNLQSKSGQSGGQQQKLPAGSKP